MSRNILPLLSFLLGMLLLAACRSPKTSQPAEFNQYIYGHTSGNITSAAPIYIWLEKTPPAKYQTGEPLPEDLLKIKPHIPGQLRLQDPKTLEFIPDHPFKNGQTYDLKLNLGALLDAPQPQHYYHFQIHVVELKASFRPGHLTTARNNDSLDYEAKIYTSDYLSPNQTEKLAEARLNHTTLPISWQHEGNTHTFQIRNIPKSEDPQQLLLHFNPPVTNYQEFPVTIPGKEQFSVINIRLNENNPGIIRIDMSADVDPNQDLNGLITIDNLPDLRYQTEGNSILLYYTPAENTQMLHLTLHNGIRSNNGQILQSEVTRTLALPSDKPAVKFIGEGNIMPARGDFRIPFSAVALKAVDLQIIKVFRQNMNFFLQDNNYTGEGDLMRTARPVFRKKIDLTQEGQNINLNRWNDFTIDLSQLIPLEKGVIYRAEIRFKKSYTTLECAGEGEDNDFYARQNWDGESYYYNDYYVNPDYKWEERDNPCSNSYYTSRHFISKNFINTSLGLMAKRSVDNRYFIAVNDILTAEPVSNCNITLYDYQNQRIDSARTDKNGFAYLQPSAKAFIVQASKDGDKAWLKIAEGNTLSLSNFDVSGQNVQSGLKGFIYGERGVWRPGDDIFLSFILEDEQHTLPAGHPVIAQLIDPKGNIVQNLQSTINDCPIHTFRFSTVTDAPTGYWKALIKIGGTTFSKTLRIETVKPNRFSINMIFPNDHIIGKGLPDQTVRVETRWLNGAPAPRRKAVTEVRLNAGNYTFKNLPDYTFQNLASDFEPYSATLFDGTTGNEGSFTFNTSKIETENAPGILHATFTTRLFDDGGDFSISSYTTDYSPYTQYAGLRLPKEDGNWYSTREAVPLKGVIVNPLGEKITTPTPVNLKVYKLNWSWWWESGNNSIGSYITRSHDNLVLDENLTARDGTFSYPLHIAQYGRYYIVVTDKKSGHSAGKIAYFGSWYDNENAETATILNLSTDKKSYRKGEKVRIKIPSSDEGVVIISLENGTSFRDIRRLPATRDFTYFEFEATSNMCPNVYVFVTLLQPVQNRNNDRPTRMYGVLNINVEDPDLHLKPEIKVPDTLRPDEDFQVTVCEAQQRPMSYTIAVVDEGLLSLTSFRTPEPFPAFYAREALGVKNWDFYDYIFGAYGARLEKAFAAGGDENLKAVQDEKNNRFKPVVLYQGPFSLKKGEKQTHTFHMPQYIGEVRTMVVAATEKGEYGSAAASSLVKQPLMISVTMPRLFTPGDTISIPVTVFALENSIKNVRISLSADQKIHLIGPAKQEVHFAEKGQQLVWFKLAIPEVTGLSTLQFLARSGKEKAIAEEQVEIRVPNPPITKIAAQLLPSQETAALQLDLPGANPQATLEISSIPPLNLAERLRELITYPHGCAEQIISAVFPQLTLNELTELSPRQKAEIETHVKTVINRLRLYQTPEGGFAYWPGDSYPSEWVSCYAAHFLISAQKRGYNIPASLLDKDLSFLKTSANNYLITSYYGETLQGYRLYVLALAGIPDLAAMNRMKEKKLQNNTAQWLLASAYALCNQPDIARNLIRNVSAAVSPYYQTGYTFGSALRDKALILQAMVHLRMQQPAWNMLEQISQALSSSEWLSTQTTAFALLTVSGYVQEYVGKITGLQLEITTDGKKQTVQLEKTVYQQPLSIRDGKTQAKVKNESPSQLYVRIIGSSAPFQVVTERLMSGLQMDISYYNNAGQPVSIRHLPQSTDVTAEIHIKNTGVTGTYENLALSYLLPSGFEIINDRLTGNTQAFREASYADIRDDRYYVYFNLKQNETKTFKFRFNAAFPGTFIQPAIHCSAMYDPDIEAVLPGGWVHIERK